MRITSCKRRGGWPNEPPHRSVSWSCPASRPAFATSKFHHPTCGCLINYFSKETLTMSANQTLLLKTNLKQLRLPAMSAEFEKLAREAANANEGYEQYLLRLSELEVAARTSNALRARIKQAGFPVHKVELLICDELGYLSFSRTGAELLFQVFAERYERGSILLTSNLAFSDWTQVFQGERMTAALLDRLTHRCHIFEMNGESYRFLESMKAKKDKDKDPKKGK